MAGSPGAPGAPGALGAPGAPGAPNHELELCPSKLGEFIVLFDWSFQCLITKLIQRYKIIKRQKYKRSMINCL